MNYWLNECEKELKLNDLYIFLQGTFDEAIQMGEGPPMLTESSHNIIAGSITISIDHNNEVIWIESKTEDNDEESR